MSVTLLQKPLCGYSISLLQDACFDLRLDAFRLQQAISERYGVKVPIWNGETRISLRICDGMEGNAYCVKAQEDGLLIAGGHYTSVHAAVQKLLSVWENRTEGELFGCGECLAGTTDIALTWEDDGSAAELLKRESKKPAYRLVWNDEFDGKKLDYEKWSGYANMHMNNATLSFDEPVVAVKDGKLVMTTTCTDPEARTYLTNYSVATHDTMNFTGGYLEMRAKVPMHAMGEWPSFWATNTNTVWCKKAYRDAHDGELYFPGYRVEVDFFEIFSSIGTVVPNLHKWFSGTPAYTTHVTELGGDKQIPNRIQLSGIDAGASKSGTRSFQFVDKDGKTAEEIANDWHTYGFLWTRDMMAFSVDGEFYYAYSLNEPEVADRFNPTFYHKETGEPMHIGMDGYSYEHLSLSIILNNVFFSEAYGASAGGKWSAHRVIDKKNDDVFFPLVYEVDYMRLYQAEGDLLFTPDVIGQGQKMYDPKRYEYALKGIKEEVQA